MYEGGDDENYDKILAVVKCLREDYNESTGDYYACV